MPNKRIIPISALEDGIKLSLVNASELSSLARRFLEDGNERFAFIIYSYSIEEFGKAVLLDQRYAYANWMHIPIIEEEIIFSSHQDKIIAALNEIDEFVTRLPIYAQTEDKEFEKIDNYLKVDNRVDMLLVDYDETSGKWTAQKGLPVNLPIKAALDMLQLNIKNWQLQYGMT